MQYIASQLFVTTNSRQVHDLVFRHNLLDVIYIDLLQQPAPLPEMRAHYMRELLLNFSKYQKERVLAYLASPGPNSQPKAMLMVKHFYNDNVAYLFDEMLALDEKNNRALKEKAAAAGGPGPAPGRGGRGAPRGRGGPPRGGRGAPRGGRGGGPPRGGRGGRGGAARGRGRGGGGGPPRGEVDLEAARWSRKFDLADLLLEQLSGAANAECDAHTMGGVWREQRVQHVAHVIQGLFYRGVDSPTLKKLFSKVEQLVTIALGPWHGADAFEGRMKALTSLTTCISTQWVWDEAKPKAKALRRTSDAIFKEVCGGRLQKALQSPPADSRFYTTAVRSPLSCSLFLSLIALFLFHSLALSFSLSLSLVSLTRSL